MYILNIITTYIIYELMIYIIVFMIIFISKYLRNLLRFFKFV